MSFLRTWLAPTSARQSPLPEQDEDPHEDSANQLQPAKPSLSAALSAEDLAPFGLENFGNTCYCNAVLQSLYSCRPFRDRIFTTSDQNFVMSQLNAAISGKDNNLRPGSSDVVLYNNNNNSNNADSAQSQPLTPVASSSGLNSMLYNIVMSPLSSITGRGSHSRQSSSGIVPVTPSVGDLSMTILNHMKSLFVKIHNQRKKMSLPSISSVSDGQLSTSNNVSVVVSPHDLVKKVRRENEMFRAPIHHDAHEFLNYLMNSIDDQLESELKEYDKLFPAASEPHVKKRKTWIHEVFGGTLANEIRCLCCDTVTYRLEPFFDLSLDIPEESCSLSQLLKHFCKVELLNGSNKFFCDSCRTYQEAEKRLKINKLPRVLVVHLKRFKYNEALGGHVKLQNRVSFPPNFKLAHNASSPKADNKEVTYNLNSVIVHVGKDPSHGHYIGVVKNSSNRWFVCDDNIVEAIKESDLEHLFGGQDSSQSQKSKVKVSNSSDESLNSPTPVPRTSSRSPPIGFGRKAGANLLPYGCGYLLFYEMQQ